MIFNLLSILEFAKIMKTKEFLIGDKVYIQDDRSNTAEVIGLLPLQTLVYGPPDDSWRETLRPVILMRTNCKKNEMKPSYWHPSLLTLIEN